MKGINFKKWKRITPEEYRDIGDEEVMWIRFHKGPKHISSHFFKKKTSHNLNKESSQ